MSVKDREHGAMSIDFWTTNKFQHLDECTNMESMKNEDNCYVLYIHIYIITKMLFQNTYDSCSPTLYS